MVYCYVENVNVSKSSDYRLFVLMFLNKHGSPIHVEASQKPFQMLHRHPVVKNWFKVFREPIRVVSVGTVDKDRAGEAVKYLSNKIVKQGGHVVDLFNVETSCVDRKVVNYRMSKTALNSVINGWVRKFGIKTVPVFKHSGERFSKEQLVNVVKKLANETPTLEYNFLLKLVEHFDVKKQRSVVVYTPELFNQRFSEKELKVLINKTRWFFSPVFPLRLKYNNEYVLTRKAKQLLYMN